MSWGGLGDKELIHKYYIAKERLERDFGLEVVIMPHALKGSDFVYNHPELRAKDFMDAIKDKTIKAIFCAIGGSDFVRILPYMDYDVIRNNPKIFMGYSDTTVSHFVMNKAGVVSYYGPSIMCEFGEYVKMIDYTENAVQNDPVQNAAFICCIDVLAELVEKYGDKVLDTISDGVNSSNVCDYIFIANGMSVLCEAEKITNADILKAYVQVAYANGLIAKSA